MTTASYATPIDILPFGKIATDAEAFQWPPPDTDLVMNVAAFGEVYESSLTVRVGQDLNLQIASIPGLVLLKPLAWADRTASKDAQDVLRLVETYGNAGNEDRLYSEKQDLLEAAGFDFGIAGSQLLAQDALAVAAPGTTATIRSFLEDPKRMTTFASHARRFPIPLDGSVVDKSRTLLETFILAFLNP